MNIKKELGQFYTKNSDYILQDLINILDDEMVIIDPFAGEGDLIDFISKKINNIKFELYDINPLKNSNFNIIEKDSLLNPSDYNNKWILTNPPYLSKNKTKNQEIFKKYETDDLYKCAIKSFVGYCGNLPCEGGIIIVPLNFFCDRDDNLRKYFLSKYIIKSINIFEEQVFADTSYTVCAFSFCKKENVENIVKVCFYPSKKTKEFKMCYNHGYRIGYDFFKKIEYNKKIDDIAVKRLVRGKKIDNKYFISNLYLRAIDTGTNNGRICLSINHNPFYAKESDRTFATLILSKEISETTEEYVVLKFNEILEKYREEYDSLFLTNFRNSTKSYSRKRISFEYAFKLVEFILNNQNID